MKRSQLVLDASARLAVEPAAAPERYPSLQAGARAQLGFLCKLVMRAEARHIVEQLAVMGIIVGVVGCQPTPRPVTVVPLPRVFVGSVRCADGQVRVTRRLGYPTLPDIVECVR